MTCIISIICNTVHFRIVYCRYKFCFNCRAHIKIHLLNSRSWSWSWSYHFRSWSWSWSCQPMSWSWSWSWEFRSWSWSWSCYLRSWSWSWSCCLRSWSWSWSWRKRSWLTSLLPILYPFSKVFPYGILSQPPYLIPSIKLPFPLFNTFMQVYFADQ